MSKPIEYRVRAVTRYIVTKHDPERESTDLVCEVSAQYVANRIATGLALEKLENDREAVAIPMDAPPPGKAMRCKLVLVDKKPYAQLITGPAAKGRTEIRTNDQGRDYTWVDPGDPANYYIDGEFVDFTAVWGGSAADGGNAAMENRIFGDATPNFRASGYVRNQGALANLSVGEEYYVDFTPARKAEPEGGC